MSSYAAALGSRRDAGDDLLFGDDDEFGSLAPAHKPRPVKADAVLAGAQVLVAKGVEAHTDGHATTAGASDAHTTGHETPRLCVADGTDACGATRVLLSCRCCFLAPPCASRLRRAPS